MTLSRWIAAGGGVGWFPVAPGTAASLVAVTIGAAAIQVSPWLLPSLALLACILGVWAVHAAGGTDDPGWIVIDEFAGQWIALLGVGAASPYGVLAAFVLFRVFDVLKPGPVGWMDRRKDAIGVMGDDIVAGVIVAAILLFATRWFPAGLSPAGG